MILGYIPEGTSYHWLAVTLEKSCLWEKQTLVLDLGHPRRVSKGTCPFFPSGSLLSLMIFPPLCLYTAQPRSSSPLPLTLVSLGISTDMGLRSQSLQLDCVGAKPPSLSIPCLHICKCGQCRAQPVGKVKVLSRSVLSYFLQPHGL